MACEIDNKSVFKIIFSNKSMDNLLQFALDRQP